MEEDAPQPSTIPLVEDIDALHMRNDSLVTVRLSETPNLRIETNFDEPGEQVSADQPEQPELILPTEPENQNVKEEEQESRQPSRSSLVKPVKLEGQNLVAELETFESKRASDISNISTIKAEPRELTPELDAETSPLSNRRGSKSSNLSMMKSEELSLDTELATAESPASESRQENSDSSEDSEDGEVNWDTLKKNEEDEPKDQESDNSTALLLARLDQENNSIATNPKSGIAKVPSSNITRPRGQSRPPSMHQLKMLVKQSNLPERRLSSIPAPVMTDMEFWRALVRDYPETVNKLPTLVSKKIRGGCPHPLRGVVWQSMAGSRDRALEEQYERLSGATSPYEGIIGKDLGRSFPGVEMFRDSDGEGQRQLGNVLKCFSLYDQKIGYCQGLGFLVGPLLMNMSDREAFCILVKLMEQYDLRSCFLPDLSGLHVRIYQFRSLLKEHLPNVSNHLEALQINPAYCSQWFLSFFAVTCPLAMLFRIFDVIFAEGASETLMRVALSLMRKNEARILGCAELEDVMQLLLSRGMWDCYHSNADELVSDFVSFSGIVTRETLQSLETAYNFTRVEVRTSDIGSMAARFLGRLWTGPPASTKPTAILSPSLSAPNTPGSFLRRSMSKQSIASTLNSAEGISDSSMSASYDTTVSRDSSNTENSSRAQSVAFGNNAQKTAMSTKQHWSKQDGDLHGQIEDLLTAMNEMQRENADLETKLQREQEEREEDKATVCALIQGLTRKARMEALATIVDADSKGSVDVKDIDPSSHITPEELSSLLDTVEDRFQTEKYNRRSSVLQSKRQLRDELARSKEQLANEISKAQDIAQRLKTEEQEATKLREQVRDSHAHIRHSQAEKQRLERQVSEMKTAVRNREKSPVTSPDGSDGGWSGRSSSASGLRELKLGRADSAKSNRTAFSKRTSSLHNPMAYAATERREREHENTSSISSVETAASSPPPSNIADNESLIMELVQAKTAKAVAEQEVEELKNKLENLRKVLGRNADSGSHNSTPSIERTVSQGGFMSYMSRTTSIASVETNSTPTIVATPPPKESTRESSSSSSAPTATALGAFWGGWGKKS